MNVAVQLEFKAERKEPLGDLIRRVAAEFERAGVQPEIRATFSDSPGAIQKTSAVARALKKHPHLARFERDDAPLKGAGIPPIRRLTSDGAEQPLSLADILALADGVPRSLPFHAVSLHFGHADFGRVTGFHPGLAPQTGIAIGDSWWVNGRNRSLFAFYGVEANAASKKLPDPPVAIGAILAALGKPRKAVQFVVPAQAAASSTSDAPSVPAVIAAIAPIVAKYRAGMTALVERVGLPHDLPSPIEARQAGLRGSGPLKPALVEAFRPRKYTCRGESGIFTLRRRSAANNIVELELDVGTWSRSLTAMFHVRGPGFNATLLPPVTTRGGGQYPIGDTEHWQRIVANLAAVVDELERTFVAEIDAAAGPAPGWFEP